jgi:predicted Zn-dependent protease with MMP-like domain
LPPNPGEAEADEFQRIAEEELASLPVTFLDAIHNVSIQIEEFPSDEVMQALAAESPFDLLGLYQGWPLPERGASYGGQPPDIIELYRMPILRFCEEQGEELRHCIRHVLVHEIGHYFGFSDDEMEAIEWQE